MTYLMESLGAFKAVQYDVPPRTSGMGIVCTSFPGDSLSPSPHLEIYSGNESFST